MVDRERARSLLASAAPGIAALSVGYVCAGCLLVNAIYGLDDEIKVGDGGAPGVQVEGGSDAVGPDAADAAAMSRYAALVLADGPVGYYRLGERAGTVLKDSSGHGHDATIDGTEGILYGVQGALAQDDGAIDLNTHTKLVVGDLFDFSGSAPWTFEAWVKPSSETTGGGDLFNKLVPNGSGGNPTGGTSISFSHVYKVVSFERWTVTGFSQGATVENVVLPASNFTHVVAAFDGRKARIYLDAVLRKEGDCPTDVADNAEPAHFGNGLRGAIDEIAIYPSSLTEGQIKAHFDAAKTP